MSPKPKTALITGITGQDGAYLARYLLGHNYRIVGLCPRRSTDNYHRLRQLGIFDRVELFSGDVTDAASCSSVVAETAPDEVYNLAAQSFVKASFDQPLATFEVNAKGTINMLEAVRRHAPQARFYQASTSELFGLEGINPGKALNEESPFHPRSPYGVAKLAAHWAVINYREAYNMHASCGILFNHESPLRGDEFVTQKIAKGVAAIAKGETKELRLGNLDVYRDWGHAEDYVQAMALMLQQDKPDDYVIATGEAHSLLDFITAAFASAGHYHADYVKRDPQFYRPADVPFLCGDPSKAKDKLGWEPSITFESLVDEMVKAQLPQGFAELTSNHPEGRQYA